MLLPLVLSFAVLAATAMQPWLTMGEATRDATLVAFNMSDGSLLPFAGFVSNIGISLWTGTAAICGFVTLALLRSVGWNMGTALVAALAMQSSLFAFDDLFMIHDRVAPDNGIRERYVIAVLAVCFVFMLTIYVIRRNFSNVSLLMIASGFFLVSILYDKFGHLENEQLNYGIEDGAKLIGIAYWVTFCVRSAWHELVPLIARDGRS